MAEPNFTPMYSLAGNSPSVSGFLNDFTIDSIEKLTGRKFGEKKPEDVMAMAEQYVKLKMSDKPSDRTQASIMMRQLENELSSENFNVFNDHIANYSADIMFGTPSSGKGGDQYSEQRKALRSYLKSKAGLAALQTGAGLFQVVDAAMKAKNLEPPKQPEMLRKNANLQDEINTTKVRAEQGDATLRQMFRDMLAEDQAVTDDRARASGSIGQYGANIQAGASRRTDAMRSYEDQVAKRKLSDRDRLRQLIGMDIQEDQAIQDGEFRRFFYNNQNYQMNNRLINEQLGSGVENIFGGLDNMVSPLSIYGASVGGGGDQPAQQMDIGAIDGVFDSQPYLGEDSVTPDLNLVEFQLLGSEDFRVPELVEKYKNQLRNQGLQVTDGFGEWGDFEQEAYDQNFNFNDSVRAAIKAWQ